MKHFHIPFVSRKIHLDGLNELDRKVGDLEEKLRQAEHELEKFRAAQRGDCVQSARCKSCEHCLSYSEHQLYYNMYTNVVCEFAIPQCQKYQKKDE